MAFIQTSTTTNSSIKSITDSIGKINAGVNTTITQVEGLQSKASAYLQSAIKSAVGTFDKLPTGLADGISKNFTKTFVNTNNPAASTVPTDISDPVTTNLSNRKPGATGFKVTGLEAGSQSLTTGKTTQGSGSLLMTGTKLLTLVNRLRVSVGSIGNVTKSATSVFSTGQLNSIFSKVSAKVGMEIGTNIADPKLRSFVSTSSALAMSTVLGVTSTKQLLAGTLGRSSQFVSNDFQSFLASAAPLSRALGGADLSNYFVVNPRYSLTDQDGQPVYTRGNNIDVATANSVLNTAKRGGCTLSVEEYFSSHQSQSLFGASLGMASRYGLDDLLDELLGCNKVTTDAGQETLGQVFAENAGSNIGVAKNILDKVNEPYRLQTADLNTTILTNPNLTIADKSTVDAVFQTLGTTTTQAMILKGASSPKYAVFDASVVPKIQTNFTNAVLNNNAVTDYFNGRQMTVGSDGKLKYI